MSAPPFSYTPLTPEGYREPALRLRDNPILIAQARRHLRRRQAAQSAGLHLLVGALVAFTAAQLNAAGAWVAGRNLLSWFILFSLYWRGAGALTVAVLSERESGAFTFFRISPLSPLTVVVGYLLGAPARAYLSALALAPAWALCAMRAGAEPLSVLLGLFAFALGALTFYAVVLAVTLSGAGRAQRAGALFLWWFPFLFAEPLNAAGVHTLSHVTPKPLLGSLHLTFWSEHITPARVLLFELPLSALVYTLLVQGLMVGVALRIAARRVARDGQPLVSRAGGVGLLGALTLLVAGVDLNPHALSPAATLSAYGGGLPGGVALLALCALGALLLLLISTPTRVAARRALARAARGGAPARLPWSAEGASLRPLAALLIVYAVGAFAAHTTLHFGAQGLDFALRAGLWPPLISCAAALVAVSGLSEAFSLQRARLNYALSLSATLGAIFLLPLLAALVAQRLEARALVEPLSALSPLYGLAYAAARLSRGVAGEGLAAGVEAFSHPLYFALSALTGLLAGGLGFKRAGGLRAELAAELAAGR